MNEDWSSNSSVVTSHNISLLDIFVSTSNNRGRRHGLPAIFTCHSFDFIEPGDGRRVNDKGIRVGMSGRTGQGSVARLSAAYIVSIVSEVLYSTNLDSLDLLITLTISSDPVMGHVRPARSRARRRSDGPRGISRGAISRTLNVPLETVRRRVQGLLEKRVVQERHDGLAVPETSPLGMIANEPALIALNAKILRQLLRSLKAQGLLAD
jgi:hypothetical protein